MTKFDFIIFDLDNTLLDFDSGERAGVAAVCRNLLMDFNEADFAEYRRINLALWKLYSSGAMKKERILRERFLQFFALKNIEGDPDAANECFLATLSGEAFLLAGALALLQELHRKVPMGIITNGHGPTQRKRLARSGIHSYFDFVLISDEFGRPKPDPSIFNEGLRLGKAEAHRTLMVGDCLINDIAGAANNGIKTCWLNSDAELPADGGVVPDWTILSIAELRTIL